MSVVIGTLTMGSTYRFSLTLTKDGATWDLTAATVTVLLRNSAGAVYSLAATVTSAPAGTITADTLTTTLQRVGLWTFCVEVVQSSVTLRSPPVEFQVVRAP